MKQYVKIFLGSKSPRRKEILEKMDLFFSIVKMDVEEVFDTSMNPADVPLYLAEKKADAYRDKLQARELLITADTVVVLDGNVIEKPNNTDEAAEMLGRLSGQEHHVITGVCLTTDEEKISFSDTTLVKFYPLSVGEIDYYVNAYKPFDKAGAYGIQEWIGEIAIASVSGCFYNVMGLPSGKLYQKLKAHNFIGE